VTTRGTSAGRTRAALLTGAALAVAPVGAGAQVRVDSTAAGEYTVYVASEATDQVAVVRFGARAGAGGTPQARVVETRGVGLNPIDPDGPHGLAFAPDGRTYYVSTAHGTPYGSLWRYDAATGRALGRVELGMFPATLQMSPDGGTAYVVNFNLHGEMVPSSVSVVSLAASLDGGGMGNGGGSAPGAAPPEELVEVARITTCAMPHGSRLDPTGARHYSACMMDDLLVEIDTRTLAVSRHFLLTRGKERGMTGAPSVRRGEHASHGTGGHGMDAPQAGETVCSPTWAQPSADGRSVFVACNKTSEIVEVDATSWTLRRRIASGDGVYNLAVTRDGKLLLGTNKRGQSVSIVDVATGKELARVPTQRKVVHGVAISPDDRYAFVSVEGIGSQPGTLEVIDLATRQRVASVDVGQMAGGVDVMPTPGR
jgi:DNA-binding beta-propeller fold protein YncE